MKKLFISILIAIGSTIACNAQEGFRVNGKIEGIPDGPLLLMSNEQGVWDTLGIVQTVGGVFTFTGKVDKTVAAYIMTADKKGAIPLILENTDFLVNIGNGNITIQGGEQQEIYNQFLAINASMLQEGKRMEQEIQAAKVERNMMKLQALQQQGLKIVKEVQAQEDELLKKYPNSYAAAYKIVSGLQKQDPEVVKARFALLGEDAKKTYPGLAVAAMLARYDKITVGKVAPDFKALTPDGGTIALSDIKGKAKLIDFWASWCAPCRKENPNVLKVYEKFHEDGLEIISISIDKDKQAWMKAIEEDKLPWNQGIDQNSELTRMFFVKGVPHIILLDENNVIIAKNLRGDALRKEVAKLLKNK